MRNTIDNAWIRNRLTLVAIAAAAGGCAPVTPPAPLPATAASAAAGGAGNCQRDNEFGPVILDRQRYDARTGADAKSFATLITSKDQPLEDCGIPAVLEKLAWLRCNDGSNPFDWKTRAAHASRAGNVGPGGRCGSIIDLYVVPCPEARYRVFADSYVCDRQP